MQVIQEETAQHGLEKAAMGAAAVAITFAIIVGILPETRTAAGLTTAGARM